MKRIRSSAEKSGAASPIKRNQKQAVKYEEDEYAEDEFEKANDSPLKQNRQQNQYNGDLNLQNVSRNALNEDMPR
jgi:hypothetical protein